MTPRPKKAKPVAQAMRAKNFTGGDISGYFIPESELERAVEAAAKAGYEAECTPRTHKKFDALHPDTRDSMLNTMRAAFRGIGIPLPQPKKKARE